LVNGTSQPDLLVFDPADDLVGVKDQLAAAGPEVRKPTWYERLAHGL
jgi:hypothetical protein